MKSIALAVAHAVQCPDCIQAYTQDCLAKGVDIEQMTEAVYVTVAIRGCISLDLTDGDKKNGRGCRLGASSVARGGQSRS